MAQPIVSPNAGSASPIARQREAIRSRIIKATLLKSHVILYIIVNVILIFINTFTSAYPWYLWALTAWGLGLGIHIFAYTAKSAGVLSYHIFMYLVVNAFLVFVNWFTAGTFSWAIWPLAGWGTGLLFHIVLYMVFKPGTKEDPNKSWMDRQIEVELKNSKETICSKCQTVNLKTAEFCASCGQKL